MAHTASCDNATTRECRCGGCAGSLHGWTGAVSMATPAKSGLRAAEHRSSDRAWRDANGPRARPGPTLRKCRAAVDQSKVDIIDWLADSAVNRPSSPKDLVESLGEAFSTDVFNALCDALATNDKNKVRADYAKNHFFCQLLAETACSMQEVQEDLDRAVAKITRSLASYTAAKRNVQIPEFVSECTAQGAVKSVDRIIQNLPAVRSFSDVLRAVRVLAIMTCPAPEKHEAVIRCCIKPLGGPIIGEEAKKHLEVVISD